MLSEQGWHGVAWRGVAAWQSWHGVTWAWQRPGMALHGHGSSTAWQQHSVAAAWQWHGTAWRDMGMAAAWQRHVADSWCPARVQRGVLAGGMPLL